MQKKRFRKVTTQPTAQFPEVTDFGTCKQTVGSPPTFITGGVDFSAHKTHRTVKLGLREKDSYYGAAHFGARWTALCCLALYLHDWHHKSINIRVSAPQTSVLATSSLLSAWIRMKNHVRDMEHLLALLASHTCRLP